MSFVKPQMLKKQWRLAIVPISVVLAVITPTANSINMALVILPISLLYFINVGLSFIAYSTKEKNLPKNNKCLGENKLSINNGKV